MKISSRKPGSLLRDKHGKSALLASIPIMIMFGIVLMGAIVGAIWIGAPILGASIGGDNNVIDLGSNVMPSAYADCLGQANTIIPVVMTDPDSATPSSALSAASSAYLKDETSGQLYTTTAATISGESLINVTGYCGNKDKWKLYIVSNRGAYSSAESVDLTLNAARLPKVSIQSNQLSYGQVKIKDTDTDSWLYGFTDALQTGTNATTGADLNESLFFSSAAAAATSKAVDANINLDIYLMSATSRKWMNEKGSSAILCFDMNNGSSSVTWDASKTTVSIGGSYLQNIKGTLSSNDLEYGRIQNSEVCYRVPGDIGNTWYGPIHLYSYAKNEPTTANGVICGHLMAPGTFLSSKENGRILNGLVTDASTQVPVTEPTGYVQTFCQMIS
jgi:hypothetical protein